MSKRGKAEREEADYFGKACEEIKRHMIACDVAKNAMKAAVTNCDAVAATMVARLEKANPGNDFTDYIHSQIPQTAEQQELRNKTREALMASASSIFETTSSLLAARSETPKYMESAQLEVIAHMDQALSIVDDLRQHVSQAKDVMLNGIKTAQDECQSLADDVHIQQVHSQAASFVESVHLQKQEEHTSRRKILENSLQDLCAQEKRFVEANMVRYEPYQKVVKDKDMVQGKMQEILTEESSMQAVHEKIKANKRQLQSEAPSTPPKKRRWWF